MSEFVPITSEPARRTRAATIAGLALLAFCAGLALMAVAMHYRSGWFGGAASATAAAQPAAAAAPPATAPVVAAAAPSVDPADPATLATRETALAAQLATLEARTSSVSVDAAQASGQAVRAEAMLVAFAARRAIDRGLALGVIEGQLRARFGSVQPRATLAVIRAAHRPVTIETLRQGLDSDGGDLMAAGTGRWWPSVRREFASLIVLHQAGTASPLPADRLARARRQLDGGQVDAALAEVARLPGAGQAQGWLTAARRYVEVHQALDTLEAAAILGQTGAVPPANAALPAAAGPTAAVSPAAG